MDRVAMDEETRQKELSAIRDALREGRTLPPITVRDLLSLFNAMRRGFWVVEQINHELSEYSLKTEPSFETIWIGDQVNFVLVPEVKASEEGTFNAIEIGKQTEEPFPVIDDKKWIGKDPTFLISRLQAAKQDIISVKPNDTISAVITILLSKGISQIPVMTNERDVKGIITWKTVGLKLALRKDSNTANDLMEAHKEFDTMIRYSMQFRS